MYYRLLFLATVSATLLALTPVYSQTLSLPPELEGVFAEPGAEDATNAALIGCANFHNPKSTQWATWNPATQLIDFWLDAYDPDFPSSLRPVRVYIHNNTGAHHIGDYPNGYISASLPPGTGLAVFYYQNLNKCNQPSPAGVWIETFRYQF